MDNYSPEIINADSMYIYKDLSIGTAKPTIEEMQGIKHHIIDVAEPSENFNVVDYRTLAKDVITDFIDKEIKYNTFFSFANNF